jgi:hypothetical protein
MDMSSPFNMHSLAGALPGVTIPPGLDMDALASIVGEMALDHANLLKTKRERDIDVEVGLYSNPMSKRSVEHDMRLSYSVESIVSAWGTSLTNSLGGSVVSTLPSQLQLQTLQSALQAVQPLNISRLESFKPLNISKLESFKPLNISRFESFKPLNISRLESFKPLNISRLESFKPLNVSRLESFKPLNISRLESSMAVKPYSQIGGFYGPKTQATHGQGLIKTNQGRSSTEIVVEKYQGTEHAVLHSF